MFQKVVITLLEIKNLSVKGKDSKALIEDISIKVEKGNIVGLTGASGSGKTTLLKTITGTFGNGYSVTSGSIYVDQVNLINLKTASRRDYCGKIIGYIPQNPMTAFNPRMKIGKQVEETLCLRLDVKKNMAREIFLNMLKKLNLSTGERIMVSYPSEISGGMLQRIAVTLVLCMGPKYILADEPTSALDEENRNTLIKILSSKRDEMGVLFVSHDVEALDLLCENVFIMENGKIIEKGKMKNLLASPVEKWTKTFSEIYNNSGERSFSWTKY
jgi:ABC-type glutathione transport system ATPase component